MSATTVIDPGRTALLLMDLQRGIVARYPGAEAVVERLVGVRDHARRAGWTIGYVRVALTEADRAAVPPMNPLFTRAVAQRSMDDDDPITAIDPRLGPGPGEIVVRKTRVGAFGTTDLDAQLTGAGCDTLVLAGISTSGVVLSTVRDAADRDYRLIVLADCCVDDPELHRFLVERILPRQAEVMQSVELLAGIG